jgi:hypothetical protein
MGRSSLLGVSGLLALAIGCRPPPVSPHDTGERDGSIVDARPEPVDVGAAPLDAAADVPADAPADAPLAADGSLCDRPTGVDLSALGSSCRASGSCPAGLSCLDVSGAVFDRICGIPCGPAAGGDCACPEELRCRERIDKAGAHLECGR